MKKDTLHTHDRTYTIREKLDELVEKWKEQEKQHNSQLHKAWEANNFIGVPRDYNQDSCGTAQRINEYNDIDHLREKFSHNILLKEYGYKNINCHAYTILNTSKLLKLLKNKNEAFEKGYTLIMELKSKNLLKESNNGKFILYFKDNRLEHSGIKDKNQVISKWGNGNIYTHKLLEVPLIYGNPKYFQLIGSEDEFKKFGADFNID